MRRVYMDNAATSFPKPPAVMEAMTRYAAELGASPGRGAYAEAREAGRLMEQCRQRLCRLIHGEEARHVIFTLNTTDALHLAIRGLVGPGHPDHSRRKPHVITTWLDHNSILRPLNALADAGHIELTCLTCDSQTGLVDPQDVKAAIGTDTALIALLHGSNVTGTLQPITEVGRIAREKDVPLLVDAAQTLGHVPIDVQRDGIDLLAFPGHKGLLGPLGTGGLYIRPGIEQRMMNVREGGTGSFSDRAIQPDVLPDRFEAGSHNAIGIIGLSEGVQWVLDRGVEAVWKHEQDLMRTMIEGLDALTGEGLTWFGPHGIKHRCGVFSVRVDAPALVQPQALSDLLEKDYGILTRSGIHCAPLAHQTIGTAELRGATRFSFGPFLTVQDVRYACDALGQIVERQCSAAGGGAS